MRGRLVLLAVAALLTGGVSEVEAQTGPYIQMDLGAALASRLVVHGSDNDWGTKCDLIINPLGVEVTTGGCDTAPPPSAWTSEFGVGAGVGAGFALGYDWGAIRLEGEYFHRVTAYDQRSSLDIFDDVSLDKREQEIELAVGGVDDLRSHIAFASLFYDLRPQSARWTPYVGAGFGVERATLDYSSVWKRNDDPERITTFADPLLRAKLAGTTTIGDARLTDVMVGSQLLMGLDYRLRDPLTVGLKLRWVRFGEFESDPLPWDQLRSHESSVGRGEEVLYQMTTKDSRFWSVGLTLRYQF